MGNKPTTTANVAKIAADPSIPPCVRDLFIELQHKPYVTVGDYLERISDESLDDLVTLADDVFLGEKKGLPVYLQEEAYSNLILFAVGLSLGEGMVDLTDEELETSIKLASMYVTLEMLYRRGEIFLHHRNMSMSEDSRHKVVAARRN